MKKLIYIEIAVVILLLVTALIVAPVLINTGSKPDDTEQNMNNPEENQEEQNGVSAGEDIEQEVQENKIELVPTWKTYPEDRLLTAKQYFVYDVQQNQFLTCSGKENERIYPASITKLFSAYVALQYLPLDKTVTATDALTLVAWDSSLAGISHGDELTVEQLVEAMMLPSGNDAACVLAVEAGRTMMGQPEMTAAEAAKAFVKQMNKDAADLGMTDTHFVNPDGIHDVNHYTTLADMVIIGKLALENKTIAKYTASAAGKIELQSAEVAWKNTNALVDPSSPYYCPYAVGLKTGQTFSAGSCLLSAFQVEKRQWLIGVFGCPELDGRFDDTLQLFNETVLY